jgi:formylmethanofuran dehydrogenase subunit E
MPDSVLFRVQKVRVKLHECDLPGPTRRKVVCSRCGQTVRDRREVLVAGRPLCKPCTEACYFSHAREIAWPDMNWTPQDEETPADSGSERRKCSLLGLH